MSVHNDQTREQVPRFLFNWHFVAKIALIIAALSCFGAVLILQFITGGAGTSYAEVTRYFSLSRHSIGPTMLVAGLILVSFASVITWLMALYTSFYIAGPLFRFARNFETLIAHGSGTMMATRKTDRLKLEEQQMRRSVTKLQQHYSGMRTAAEQALAQLGPHSAAAITQLKELDHEARL